MVFWPKMFNIRSFSPLNSTRYHWSAIISALRFLWRLVDASEKHQSNEWCEVKCQFHECNYDKHCLSRAINQELTPSNTDNTSTISSYSLLDLCVDWGRGKEGERGDWLGMAIHRECNSMSDCEKGQHQVWYGSSRTILLTLQILLPSPSRRFLLSSSTFEGSAD